MISTQAAAFGVTIGQRYVVWPQTVGQLSALGQGFPDTDLFLYSLATHSTFRVQQIAGQQGYPDLSGNLLVWQDAVRGGDDVFAGQLPGDL